MLPYKLDLIFAAIINKEFNSLNGSLIINSLAFIYLHGQTNIELKELVAVVFLSVLVSRLVILSKPDHRHFMVADGADQVSLSA